MRSATRELRRISRTHYPGFLFGAGIRAGQRYAFVYHDIEPDEFRRDLEFLNRNRYATIGVDEFIRSTDSSRQRSVLLTFDDARRNFWEVAFPILEEFGARATLFVPTRWIDGSESGSRGTFMTWDQIRQCERSDSVDVESHAHRHCLVYTGAQVVAWATPETVGAYDVYEWPLRMGSGREQLGPPPLGTPIYPSEPLLSADYAMVDRAAVRQACEDLVASKGGDRFFHASGWRSRLAEAHRQAAALEPPADRMDDGTFRALVESEFELSRQLFQQHLGRPPRVLAYPWMLGSDLSLRAATESGIEAVFGVGLDFRRAREAGGPLPAFGRLKGDWLRFLPGSGRQRLHTVVWSKVRQLTSPRHLSH